MSYSNNIREEEIKNRLRKDFFEDYDAEQVLGDIDFAVAVPISGPHFFETEYLLWAEAKKGTQHDIYESFVQLIITIGKARTFDKVLPPSFLGAFDAEKIAFIPYNTVLDIFYQNDFNWNVKPSDHETKEFKQVLDKVKESLQESLLEFNYDRDEKDLRLFIKNNFIIGKKGVSRIRINKNNFTSVYQKWLQKVKPSIAVDWELAKKQGIIDADFYLADILSEHNVSLREKLYVLLRNNYYELDRKIDATGFLDSKKACFNDKQVAHTQFWNHYERPPKREYWDYIVERRDLLVPQDVRERKGSFFTPRKWVDLSQQYLAEELGENWQDEYYVWDCCGGTGNLEAGLTNKYHIWVSTLDQADVDVIHDRIRHMNEASTNGQGANLLDKHVFQFDFLNDPFDLDNSESKLPDSLGEVLKNDEKRKKLVIYINPPYAEASNSRTITGTGTNRVGLSFSQVKVNHAKELGRAGNELFAQFFARIFDEIKDCHVAMFSKLKMMQGPNFARYRVRYPAAVCRVFMVPAKTFDNVSGEFPIGFQIYDTSIKQIFHSIEADVYNASAEFIGKKNIYSYSDRKYIIDWLRQYYDKTGEHLAYLRYLGTDFQNNNGVFITLSPSQNDIKQVKGTWTTAKNIVECCVYFSVRLCIPATWLNDREQFLYPNDEWVKDNAFLSDCIIYTLFHTQNRISCQHGTNHWIPFTEDEVGAQEAFDSHFMSNFLHGKAAVSDKETKSLKVVPMEQDMFATEPLAAAKIQAPIADEKEFVPLENLTPEAKAVMDAGRELWRYYHQQPDANPNASLYDIRLHFQDCKTTKTGKVQMNTDSKDEQYTALITKLRHCLKELAKGIEPKVYEYGFLLK